jgi:hypothetical protein
MWASRGKAGDKANPAAGLVDYGAFTLFKAKFRAEKNQELN